MPIATETEARVMLGLMSTITDEERAVLNLLLPAAEAKIADHIHYDPCQRVATEIYPRQDPAGGYITGTATWDVDAQHRRAQMIYSGGSSPLYPTLQLARLPLRSITDVWVDYNAKHGSATGAFAAATKWVQGTQYWGEWDETGYGPTGCVFANTLWPRHPGTIKVTYRAGYSPEELMGRATTTHTDTDGTITTAGVNASALKRACLLTLASAVQKWAALKKGKVGWVPGGIQSENLGDYSYTVGGNAAATIAALVVELPGAAADLCEPFVHYGVMRL
jgi:hypothetical protein